MTPINKLITGIMLLCILPARSQTISSSINVNEPVFLQALTGVYDTLTIDNVPDGTVSTNFLILNYQGDSIGIATTLDESTAIQDMGLIDTAASVIQATFYDGDGNSLGMSDEYSFSVKRLPSWAAKIDSPNNGQIVLESFDPDGTARIFCTLPLYQKLLTMPDDVWGIGGKQFGINQNNLTFTGTYDLDGGAGTINTDSNLFNFQLAAFELTYPNPPYSFNLDSLPNTGINLAFDPGDNLELLMDAKYSNSMNLFKFKSKEWTMFLPPPVSALKIGVSVGVNLDGGFSARALMGVSGDNQYGFVGDVTTDSVSSVTIGGAITGTVWGNISLISKKLGGIEGELWLRGNLGAQYRFVTVPAFQDKMVWGGDMQLGGKIRLTGIGGSLACTIGSLFGGSCGDDGEVVDGNIWPTTAPYPINGGLPNGLNFGRYISAIGNPYARSVTYENNYMDDALKNLSQQSFSTKGTNIGVVWIEEDSISQHLAFSEKTATRNAFREGLLVNDTAYGINHPKVGLTGNGSAIIVWAQNKLKQSDITSATPIDSILDAQDIWIAIYDAVADTIVYRNQIYEVTDLSDGMPNVTISDSDKAIITWLAEDPETGFTDIWEAELSNQNGVWYQSDPFQLTESDGNNFSVQVAFIDSSHAVATWINDPDGDDSVPGNNIMYAYYDGTTWRDPVQITDADDQISYQELAMDFNGGYGALAYTYTDYSDTVNTQSKLSVEVYDLQSQAWLTANEYDFEDSLSDVRLPRISVSKDGIVAASFQTVAIQTDSNFDANHGLINMIVQNIPNSSGWTLIQNNQLIADSNVLVWDMDLAFGANNTLYSLSHEIDTVAGNFYHPATGVLFGNPGISLVLRGLQFSDALAIDSLPQDSLPQTPAGITPVTQSDNESLTIKAYPNPFSSTATIEFYVPENANTRLEIFDMLGKSITIPVNQMLGQGTYRTVIGSLNLERGIYIARLISRTSSKYCKLIKQ